MQIAAAGGMREGHLPEFIRMVECNLFCPARTQAENGRSCVQDTHQDVATVGGAFMAGDNDEGQGRAARGQVSVGVPGGAGSAGRQRGGMCRGVRTRDEGDDQGAFARSAALFAGTPAEGKECGGGDPVGVAVGKNLAVCCLISDLEFFLE